MLPRLPDNIDLIWVEFKRMLVYKSNHYQDYIRPQKVMTALMMVEGNNDTIVMFKLMRTGCKSLKTDPMCGQLVEGSTSEEALIIDENTESGQENDEEIQHDRKEPSDIDLSNVQENELLHRNADSLKIQKKKKEGYRKTKMALEIAVKRIKRSQRRHNRNMIAWRKLDWSFFNMHPN